MNPKDPIFSVLNCAKDDKKIWCYLNNLRICEIKSISEVSKKEGFQTIEIILPEFKKTEICCDLNSQKLLLEWNPIIEKIKKHFLNRYTLVYCKNIKISYISFWDRFDLFSPSYDCIIEKEFRIWIKQLEGKMIYKILSSDDSKVLIDFNFLDAFHVHEKCVFIGSNQNWGHWALDVLPQIALAEAHPDSGQLKYVFGKLDENQSKSLEFLGIDADKIINLEKISVGNGAVSFFHFDDILILPPVVKSSGLHFLRERYRMNFDFKKNHEKRIFISRRNDFPGRRVANIEEIEKVFTEEGFTIIHNIKDLPFEEQFRILHDADMVAFVSGAEYGNIAFLNADATIIVLLAAYFLNIRKNTELVEVLLIRYLIGSGLKTILVAGESVDPDDISTHAQAYYDPEHLRKMLQD